MSKGREPVTDTGFGLAQIKREGACYINGKEVTEEEYLKHEASKTPEDKFKAIRRKLERSFEDAIIAVEDVTAPNGMIICLSPHHQVDIIKAVSAYIAELGSAYFNGELRVRLPKLEAEQ